MPEVQPFAAGHSRFLTPAFQSSGGVAADLGYAIERARFVRPLPLAQGFDAIEASLARHGRSPTAFCACELRSPGQFSEQGFIDFNRHYVQRLEKWGIFRNDINPVARSNVCPEIDPPAEPSFYAFSFTRPSQGAASSFVVAGGAESRGGEGSYAERIVRYRDLSPEGIKEKVRFTTREMEARLGAFGSAWKDTTAVQTYTVHDFHPVVVDELVRRGAARSGLTWHFARPPVIDLEYEMDCRQVLREIVI